MKRFQHKPLTVVSFCFRDLLLIRFWEEEQHSIRRYGGIKTTQMLYSLHCVCELVAFCWSLPRNLTHAKQSTVTCDGGFYVALGIESRHFNLTLFGRNLAFYGYKTQRMLTAVPEEIKGKKCINL